MKRVKTERDEFVKKSDGSYRREKGEIFFQLKRVRTKKGYRIQTHQILNPENIRKKGFRPKLKIVNSRKGSTFKTVLEEIKGGKILAEYRRQKVSGDTEGRATYEYLSRNRPRSTPKKRGKEERYSIQFVGYFLVILKRTGRQVIVLGYSDGYLPGDRMPPREKLKEEAEERARGKAGFILQSSDFVLTLIEGGFRYHSFR